MRLQPFSPKGVREEAKATVKKKQLKKSNALAILSTSRATRDDNMVIQALQLSWGKCQICQECLTSISYHHTSSRCSSGTTWKWWDTTQDMERSTHSQAQVMRPPPQREAQDLTLRATLATKDTAIAANRTVAAHLSTTSLICRHHHRPCFGHTCQACTRKAKATRGTASRSLASYRLSKTAKRSGATTTATWMKQMAMKVHQDLSISNLQARSKLLINLGISTTTTKDMSKFMSKMLIIKFQAMFHSEIMATNVTVFYIKWAVTIASPQICTRQHLPSVECSNLQNSTWVPNNQIMLKDNPNIR